MPPFRALYFTLWQYEDGPGRAAIALRKEREKVVRISSYLSVYRRDTIRARDYLNGYGPFGRYNFFNISAPIGAGHRPLKDHPPPAKVGRLPRRHRKTPSSGSGAAPVISRKPRHFACIIHSNSPGIPPLPPDVESATATEKKQRGTRSFRSLVLFLRERLLPPSQSSKTLLPNVIIGMSLVRDVFRHSQNTADDIPWVSSNSFHVDVRLNLYCADVCAERSFDPRYIIPFRQCRGNPALRALH